MNFCSIPCHMSREEIARKGWCRVRTRSIKLMWISAFTSHLHGRKQSRVHYPCVLNLFSIGLSLSLICQLTSEDIKQHYLPTFSQKRREDVTTWCRQHRYQRTVTEVMKAVLVQCIDPFTYFIDCLVLVDKRTKQAVLYLSQFKIVMLTWQACLPFVLGLFNI